MALIMHYIINIMLSIAEFIRKQGMTQAAFAKQMGISEAMLSLCLHGKRRFGLNTALKAKKITGMGLDEIYRGAK
jgi:plasmid maintenance system antidote protein VapI